MSDWCFGLAGERRAIKIQGPRELLFVCLIRSKGGVHVFGGTCCGGVAGPPFLLAVAERGRGRRERERDQLLDCINMMMIGSLVVAQWVFKLSGFC